MHRAATYIDIMDPADRGLGPVAFNARRAELGAELKAFADATGIHADQLACDIAAGSMLSFPGAHDYGMGDAPMGLGVTYIVGLRVARAYVAERVAAMNVAEAA